MAPKQHSCWICNEVFQNGRDLKNHMSSAIHYVLQVMCPFCPEEKLLKRSTPELMDHCKRYHPTLMKENGLDSEFFKEGNGFWLSTKPRDYRDLVKVTAYDSSRAEQARELVRRWLRRWGGPNHEEALKSWESNWRVQRRQPRLSSVESESRFIPDYEDGVPPQKKQRREYDPEAPSSTPSFNIQSISMAKGVEAMLWAEGTPIVWYRISVDKDILSSSKDLTSLCRRMTLCKPAGTDPPTKFKTYGDKKSRLRNSAAKSLGISPALIKEISIATSVEFTAKPLSEASTPELPNKNQQKRHTPGGDADDQRIILNALPVNNRKNSNTNLDQLIPASNPIDESLTDEDTIQPSSKQPVSTIVENDISTNNSTDKTSPANDTLNCNLINTESSQPLPAPVSIDEDHLSATNSPSASDDRLAGTQVLVTDAFPSTLIDESAGQSENRACALQIPSQDKTLEEEEETERDNILRPPSPYTDAFDQDRPVENEVQEPVKVLDVSQEHQYQGVITPESQVPDTPSRISIYSGPSFNPARSQVPNNIQDILSWGCMPLCPPARRNWDREVTLNRGGVSITWPPRGWTQMTSDQKLLQWEYAAMRFEQEVNKTVSAITRGELLDKYNFLALPGTKCPPYVSPVRKARYYNYETLRCNPEMKLVEQVLLARGARDSSVDDLIRILNKNGVLLRL